MTHPLDRWNAAMLTVIVGGVAWMTVQGCAAAIPALGNTTFGELPYLRAAVAGAVPVAAEVAPAVPAAPAPRVEPDWVVQLEVAPTAPPPDDVTCGPQSTAEAPVPNPPPTSSASGAAPPAGDLAPGFDVAAMMPWDISPNAKNAHLPEAVRARLGVGAAFDVATVPLEPLHGRDEDRARVAEVFARAARREGTTRLAFWGASHVAGEFFTGEVRRLLQDRYGDAGHGFVMPAAPWKGYRASDVNLCTEGTWASDFHNRVGGRADGLLGFAGMSVEAATAGSTGWVQTTLTNPHGRKVSRFEVYFLRQPGGGTFEVVVDDAPPEPVSTFVEPDVPVGPGAVSIAVPDGPHRLVVRPVGDAPVRLFGASMERDEPGVVVDAMGVSGRTVSSWNAWDEELQRSFLDRRPPDLAVLAYGTNEANDARMTEDRYRETLVGALRRLRRTLPDTPCILIGPSDRGKKVRGTSHVVWGPTEMVARVQQEVGPSFGCLTWDLQAATGGPGSMFRWREADLAASDLIHFSAAGYRELARRFVTQLDPSDAMTSEPSPR